MEIIEVEDAEEDEEDAAQGDGQPLSTPQDDSAEENVVLPTIGWTVKTYDKLVRDSLVRTTDFWGSFTPTTLIGTHLWSMSATCIRTPWRTLIGSLGHASTLRMKRRVHTSWT